MTITLVLSGGLGQQGDLPRLVAGPADEPLNYARGADQPRVRDVALA